MYAKLREERSKLEEDLKAKEANFVLQLQHLFDQIDPETSCALPNPTPD